MSSIGTQFFKHYATDGFCEYAAAGESAEHIFAKHGMAAGERDAGAIVHIERGSRRGDGGRWRADVMATAGDKRTALEIHHSPQATDRYIRRHRRYEDGDVDAVWFVSGDALGHARLQCFVPVLQVEIDFSSATVVGLSEDLDQNVALREFVSRWLQGQRPKLGQPVPAPQQAVNPV
ncbi:competence protein CoiA family protein [Microterricola pindariensis]|uniref:competence protein CoiA family protein n=1 Tax=Microterricola pindariensis TaxID=478010 RepID=UPI0010571404|nr:hypothetical protein [Microterricola pindariensis]